MFHVEVGRALLERLKQKLFRRPEDELHIHMALLQLVPMKALFNIGPSARRSASETQIPTLSGGSCYGHGFGKSGKNFALE